MTAGGVSLRAWRRRRGGDSRQAGGPGSVHPCRGWAGPAGETGFGSLPVRGDSPVPGRQRADGAHPEILFLVEQGLLGLPVLYLSRYIIDHKAAYYEGLRRVTEEGSWEE